MFVEKRKIVLLIFIGGIAALFSLSFKKIEPSKAYANNYFAKLNDFKNIQQSLYNAILKSDVTNDLQKEEIKKTIQETRLRLKAIDFWLRYLEPVDYKKINGPLPVEWETEVFEKFEKPYKRDGAGLSLAMMYLDEEPIQKDSLLHRPIIHQCSRSFQC